MTRSRQETTRPTSLRSSLGLRITFLVLAIFFFASTAPAQTSTAFLPFKISGDAIDDQITAQMEAAIRDGAATNSFSMVSRASLTGIIDYSASWPPPVSALQSAAEKAGVENLAVGQIFVIGEQISIDVKLFDLLSPQSPTYYVEAVNSPAEMNEAMERISGEIKAYTEREFRIASIAPEGNTRIDSGAILRKIATKSGDVYDQAALRKDLKSIYGMGYFNDVQIDVADSAEGKRVVFRVVEKPVINSVSFEGIDELKEEDVREAANLKEHQILNPLKINQAKEAILQLYKTKGFYNSTVDESTSYPDDTGANVVFKINEGEKIFIKEITIEGNKTFDSDDLLDEIESSEKGFLSWLTESGLLDVNMVKQDAQRIVAYYNNHGFLEAKIGEPQITQEKEWLYVKFVVEEGPRFRVGDITVSGDLIASEDELLSKLAVGKNEYISRQTIRDDIMNLNDFYAESGYAFASIRPSTTKSPAGDRMDINFKVTKGNLVYIDRITIRGNTRTRDNVIRRELQIVEGGVFNSKALRESTQNLQRLMYFEDVTITPEPSLDPNRMNVIVDVKERSTGTFSIGAGYSSVDKIILMGQISENNLFGRGDTLSLSANISGTSTRYNLAYTNPHLNDSELSWGLDLFNTYREYDDYTKDSQGGGIRIGYPIFEKWRIYGNYSFTNTDLTDVSDDASYIIRNSVDLHVTSSVKASLVRDTRNKRYGASEGSRHVLSVEYAGGPFGGDAQFTKFEGSTSWFFPLFWKTVFHVKGAAGQVFENEDNKLPVYERFYLGGLNSVRGFEYAKISPIDEESGERYGGDKMWYTNVELIFPLLEAQGLLGVLFYDSGQVLDDNEDWGDFDESVKQAVGVGVRWLSPMGPLRLVWGHNLDPADGEDTSVWDFSIGGTF